MTAPIITVENLSKRCDASVETVDHRHWTIDSDASAAPFFSLKSIVQGLTSNSFIDSDTSATPVFSLKSNVNSPKSSSSGLTSKVYSLKSSLAVATVNGMDFLVTWNMAHINNPFTRMMIRQVAENAGYVAPEICTPEELFGGEP